VTENRWREIAERLDALTGRGPLATAICEVAGERLGTTNVGLVLCIDRSYDPLGSSDPVAGFLDEQQFALGDGPSWACSATALPVLAGDLGSPASAARWPAFGPTAASCGVRAAFSFPLQVGLATVAVLTAYRNVAGELSPSEYVDGLTVASLATTAMMAEQSGEHTAALAEVFRAGVEDGARLQRAAGMVAEHQSINILEAMVRIRAHAFGCGRPLGDIARDLCDRKLVLPAKEEQ
jgi:hypothetical protein